MKNIKILKFNILGDNRGSLVSLEQFKNVPFEIKRVYYIFDTKRNIARGNHAHKNLEQVLICVSGSCTIKLDNGKEKKQFLLDYPDKGLYVGRNIWGSMVNFSQGCVLMVLASDIYNSSEYIRDYAEFLKNIKF